MLPGKAGADLRSATGTVRRDVELRRGEPSGANAAKDGVFMGQILAGAGVEGRIPAAGSTADGFHAVVPELPFPFKGAFGGGI